MTRATAKPVRRVVQTMGGEMVLEVTDRTCTLRPVGTRRGGPQERSIAWGSVYLRLMDPTGVKRPAKKGGRK